MPIPMHQHEVAIDESLVRRLVDSQFPHLSNRVLRIVEPWGTDNAIWRLGHDLVVRLPRIEGAVGQIGREADLLPELAPQLPVELPEPVAVGDPDHDYPFPWAIHRWLEGRPAAPGPPADADALADGLADVVSALRALPIDRAPEARGRARPRPTTTWPPGGPSPPPPI